MNLFQHLRSIAVTRSAANWLAAAGLCGLAALASAADGPIVIGQSCDLSTSTAARTLEFAKGADLYIESVNKAGGIGGRPIKLVRYDDAFKPARTAENAKRLVEQDGVMLLYGMGSAPSTQAILPYVMEKGVPVFGSLSGADSLRKTYPMLFHFKASFGDEIRRIAMHLATIGLRRVGVLASDLPIGSEGAAALGEAALDQGLEVVYVGKVARNGGNLKAEAEALAKAAPQAILILAPAGPGVEYTRALKEARFTGQLVGLSVMSSDTLHKALGELSRGMIITQVVPFPWGRDIKMSREYRELMETAKVPMSIDSMEGYMSARLMVEALRQAGTPVTRESFVAALERMNHRYVDGVHVSLSSNDHVATRLVNITMIGRSGRLVN